MARRFDGAELVLATHNKGKIAEFETMFAPHGVAIRTAVELGLDEPEETGDSFVANALLKARAATAATGLPALADDSGMCARGLDGAPGIYSARWAGPDRDFGFAIRRVLGELETRYGSFDAADKAASFVAVLALCWPDGHAETFEGIVEGRLVEAPRGGRGFGYDPIFIPEGHEQTFGEMDPVEKHKISHRHRAVEAMRRAIFPAA